MDAINNLTESLIIGQTIAAGRLSMVPLRATTAHARDYLLLEEALTAGNVEVGEIADGGSVPNLRIINKGDRAVLMIDGDTLVGAKQNRTLNVSILAPAGLEIIIPVSCVEAGRWSRASEGFRSSRHHMFATGRARMMEDTHRSMDDGSMPRADQLHVWADIDRKMKRMDVESATNNMDEMFESREPILAEMVTTLTVLSDQMGAIFAVDGHVLGMDCFTHAEAFAVMLPKLVRSYGLEALDSGFEPELSDIQTSEEFLLLVASTERLEAPAPGIGKHVRLRGPEIIGTALVVDDAALHVSAFIKPAAQDQ